MANIYFTRITKDAESSYSLSPRQMALLAILKEDHTSELAFVWRPFILCLTKLCSACSRVFVGDYLWGLRCVYVLGLSGLSIVTIWSRWYVWMTGSSPCTQTWMFWFLALWSGVWNDAAHRKRRLRTDAVTLLKRVRNFLMAQDIGARAAGHIFNRIEFSITKGVRAQIVSRFPYNVL
ncbi:hypothetical protein Tco_0936594 [Tanacetum coccineum]|uniref:Uncharacterized protein n=1 Tax=Tanacetum coccineum TaxID=301880 RepID=A0ABQ5DIT5_9ASTR